MNILEQFRLDDKVALVTGGYSNLGKAITEAFLEAGARTIVCGRNEATYRETFPRNLDKLHFEYLDISSTESIIRCYENVMKQHGRIDILVNNAVYSKGSLPENITDKEWEFSIDGVLNSVYRCIREVIPYFQKSGKGNIINVSSMYGMVSPDFRIYEGKNKKFFNPPNYGAAKAGVIQLTRYMAVYLAQYNIRVNCLTPGPFPSKKVQKNRDFIEKLKAKNPSGRIGSPEDLKAPIVFLASDASSFVIGHNLVVDGGWTIW